MLIFEVSNRDVFYASTVGNGVLGGEPFAMALGEWSRRSILRMVVERMREPARCKSSLLCRRGGTTRNGSGGLPEEFLY